MKIKELLEFNKFIGAAVLVLIAPALITFIMTFAFFIETLHSFAAFFSVIFVIIYPLVLLNVLGPIYSKRRKFLKERPKNTQEKYGVLAHHWIELGATFLFFSSTYPHGTGWLALLWAISRNLGIAIFIVGLVRNYWHHSQRKQKA